MNDHCCVSLGNVTVQLVSLSSPSWSKTHFVPQAGSKSHQSSCLSLQALRLQASASKPVSYLEEFWEVLFVLVCLGGWSLNLWEFIPRYCQVFSLLRACFCFSPSWPWAVISQHTLYHPLTCLWRVWSCFSVLILVLWHVSLFLLRFYLG